MMEEHGKQCDQFGQFLIVHGNEISYNSSPKILFGPLLKSKLVRLPFGTLLEKCIPLLIPISGHTEEGRERNKWKSQYLGGNL